MHKLIDFIFYLLKNVVRLAVLGVVAAFILFTLTILMPSNAIQAIDIVKGLIA